MPPRASRIGDEERGRARAAPEQDEGSAEHAQRVNDPHVDRLQQSSVQHAAQDLRMNENAGHRAVARLPARQIHRNGLSILEGQDKADQHRLAFEGGAHLLLLVLGRLNDLPEGHIRNGVADRGSR